MSADRTCGSYKFWVFDGDDARECWVHAPAKTPAAPEAPTPGVLARVTSAADSCGRYQLDEGLADLYEE